MIWLFLEGPILWVFVVALLLGVFGTVQSEKPFGCSFLIGAGLIALQLFSPYHPFTFAVHNPVESLIILAAYAAIGTVWCVVKWASFVHQLKDRYLDYKNEYLEQNQVKTFEEYEEEYKASNPLGQNRNKYVESISGIDPGEKNSLNIQETKARDARAKEHATRLVNKPHEHALRNLGILTLPKTALERSAFLRSHKSNIYMWITFWPFSLVGTIFDDPVRRFLRFTYARIANMLGGITERAFKNI